MLFRSISKRNDKPDAIAWLLKNQEDLSDAQISRLVGTTKPTINAVRDRTHWNSSNLRPRHPVELGLCTRVEIDAEITKAREKKARQAKKKSKTQARPAVIDPAVAEPSPGSAQDTGSEETPAVPPLEDSPQDESSRDDSTDPSGTL